jgi:hypothetical protein
MINKPKGLNYLSIREHKISLDINARVLGKNYKLGISLNTIDQLRHILCENGLTLHQDFINETKISLAHIKNDVSIDSNNLINELSTIDNNKYFKVVRDNSITFENKNKTESMNTIFYGKYSEMLNNKNKYSNLPICADDFIGLSRMETRLNNWRTVQKYLSTRNLNEILNQRKVNYLILTNNILKGQQMETKQLDLSQFKTIAQLDDYARTKLLFEQCNGNYTQMVNELKNRLGKNTKTTYQTNKLKKLLPLVKHPEGRKLESISTLKEQLKNS